MPRIGMIGGPRITPERFTRRSETETTSSPIFCSHQIRPPDDADTFEPRRSLR